MGDDARGEPSHRCSSPTNTHSPGHSVPLCPAKAGVAPWSIRTEKKGCMGCCVHFGSKTVLFLSSPGGVGGGLVEQTHSSGWWDWSCGAIPPAGRGWSSKQVSFDFPGRGGGASGVYLGRAGAGAAAMPGEAWWVGLGPAPRRGVPGFCAPSGCSLKPSSWVGRAGVGHRCVEGGRSRWWSRASAALAALSGPHRA